jgi:outer membrane protein TolC
MRSVAAKRGRSLGAGAFVAMILGALEVWGASSPQSPDGAKTCAIDLASTLRLAGARNLDIQIARERGKEAQAHYQSAVEQFFPWVAPGIGYHRRDGMAQAVPAGTVSETDFESYGAGAGAVAQVAVGEAIYKTLAARQLVKASEGAFEAQRQDSTLGAAQGYFELAKAKALVGVATQALSISLEYQQQVHAAVGAGLAFRGDELRVQTQTERYQIAGRQAREQQRLAAAVLAQLLHLDPSVDLIPQDSSLVPLTLFETNVALSPLVEEALATRPEVKQGYALVSAAREVRKGAVYGPLIPVVGAQMWAGGLGGGHDASPSAFGGSEDYLVGIGWRIGPGGLFDAGRINASKAQLAVTELSQSKLQDSVTLEVVAAFTRAQSLYDQMGLAERNLGTASEVLRLTRQRKQFGVGAVLEDLLAQQDLTRARSEYVSVVADYNKAQYALQRAVGVPPGVVGR